MVEWEVTLPLSMFMVERLLYVWTDLGGRGKLQGWRCYVCRSLLLLTKHDLLSYLLHLTEYPKNVTIYFQRLYSTYVACLHAYALPILPSLCDLNCRLMDVKWRATSEVVRPP